MQASRENFVGRAAQRFTARSQLQRSPFQLGGTGGTTTSANTLDATSTVATMTPTVTLHIVGTPIPGTAPGRSNRFGADLRGV